MKTDDKKKRAVLKEPLNYIKFEPYRTIINSLKLALDYEEFKGGLETKELRYLIVKGYAAKPHKGFRRRKGSKKNTIIELFKETMKSNSNIEFDQSISTTPQGFNKLLKKLDDSGWIKRKNRLCHLSGKYKLDILNLRKSDIIMDTDFEHVVFRPPGYKHTFYNPGILAGHIRCNVKDYEQRIKKVEKNLQTAYYGWLGILKEARDSSVQQFWDDSILCRKDVHVLSKFFFCLVMIYEIEEILILDHPKRSPNEQWELLMRIHDRAISRYIKKRYPDISSSQMATLEKIVAKDEELKHDFFDELERKIRRRLDPSLLDSIIIIDTTPGLGPHRYKDLAKAGIIEVVHVDRNKPIDMQQDIKEKTSEEQPVDYAENKYLMSKRRRTPVDKEVYVEPPFFKGFFKGFEKDLMGLGFKSGGGDNSLKYFYSRLDERAKVLRIPSLPYDLDALLAKVKK